MSGIGVLFAVEPAVVDRLRAFDDDDDLLEFLHTQIEEPFYTSSPEWVCDLGKTWDAIHRSLTDGDVGWSNGTYPRNHAILGGEQLYEENDYIISLKDAEQVGQIAAALGNITPQEFRRGYDQIPPEDYDGEYGLDDFHATWDEFEELVRFYQHAATAQRPVLFTVDL
ncbi:MAG TPA: DUF1877 family protein [Planctomycetaceae bacterium]|nr:DUF1877 family protein [Planctomycetaceae bacterium]